MGGLESLFHGLMGLVPTYKKCLQDKAEIVNLLHEFEDFRHPAELAQKIFVNMKAHGIDLSLDAAAAVLAYKGKEWERVGLSVGDLLKMAIPSNATVASLV